jgi:hypothetical protein
VSAEIQTQTDFFTATQPWLSDRLGGSSIGGRQAGVLLCSTLPFLSMLSLFAYYFLLVSSFLFGCWMGIYSLFPRRVLLMTDPPAFATVRRLPFYVFENTGETFNLFSAIRDQMGQTKRLPTMDSVFHDLLSILFACFSITWLFKGTLILLSFWGAFCHKKVFLVEDRSRPSFGVGSFPFYFERAFPF